MSRIDTAALQAPKQNGNGAQQQKRWEAPDVNIGAEDYNPQPQQQQQQPQESASDKYLKMISENMQNITQASQRNPLLEQVQGDPNIQQYLQGKQQGKQFKLVDEEQLRGQQQGKEEQEEEPDWEALRDDPRKLTTTVVKSVTRELQKQVLPAVQRMVQERFEPVNQLAQQVSQISELMMQQQTERYSSEVENVRQRVGPENFDRARPLLVQLQRQYPGMPVADLWNLASSRIGLPNNFNTSVQTERPTSQTSAVPPVSSNTPQGQVLNAPGGRTNNFRAAFNQQLERVLANTQIGPL